MDSLDLSRRAVAAGWKWQAGALDETGYRAISEVGDGLWQLGRRDCMGNLSARPMLPDFRDAATRGVLLQQVRERWNDPWLCVAWTGVIWICVDRHGIGLVPPCRADSETAALLAAMEAAPNR
jgi:hypothetical protein